ncbi:hypothetical protein Syun_027726 [Stephania yunnanensis]|uniref:Uncharacterized protein n=1 Tax=Stephania yunnanensis TaxID=152371 RepID=A0AAP0EG37_9MAGN
MERQEKMQRDKMERQEENRDMQDRLARMEALLMQHIGIRPHVPRTPWTPPSLVTERPGPQSDDQPGHLTTDIAPSQSAHPNDYQPEHWTDPHISLPYDQCHILDDHDEFMSLLTPPTRPPPWYVHRWHLILVLLMENELTRLLYGGDLIFDFDKPQKFDDAGNDFVKDYIVFRDNAVVIEVIS